MTARDQDALTRAGEIVVATPELRDASLVFIGVIRTPFADRRACPRQGDQVTGPGCRIDVAEPWRAALAGLVPGDRIDVVYWLHLSRRDLVVQNPHAAGRLMGTFALRSPQRPNPLGISTCRVLAVDATGLDVRGLDCVDGTPLIDIKPQRCPEA